MGRAPALVALLVSLAAARASGQQRTDIPVPPIQAGGAPPRPGPPAALGGVLGQAWVRPIASLIVPGSGQLLGNHDRGLVYLAAEVWIVTRAAALTREGRRDRRAFQDLAYQVARAQFTTVRHDGGFEYYESMTHFVESGRYDADPGPGFAPEPDTLTYNGSTWLLARRTYFVDPDSIPSPGSLPYQAALTFYQSRAVGGEFQWSWRDARLEQDVFRSEIRTSDDAFRAATNYLGVLVLNHLGSAIDALITIRLTGSRPALVPHVEPGEFPGEVRLLWRGRF